MDSEKKKNNELKRYLNQGEREKEILNCYKKLAAAILNQSIMDYNKPCFEREKYFIKRFSNTAWCENLCTLAGFEFAKYKKNFVRNAG